MDRLIFGDKVIDYALENILNDIKSITNSPKRIRKSNDSSDILCSCPFHKGGLENKPSCSIYIGNEDKTVPVGSFHCWSCGESGTFQRLVGKFFEESTSWAKEWLLDNYQTGVLQIQDYIPQFKLPEKKCRDTILSESFLNKYEYDNPVALEYLISKRHLTKQVIDWFKIGYNKEENSVTFPVRDSKGRLLGVTERNIDTKRFHIPKNLDKPIYLLDEAVNYKKIYVCESQINALTLWSWGYPAIALFGTGCGKQYEQLSKLGSRVYVLCLDGDVPGDNGCKKFYNALKENNIIFRCEIPRGKDVNDLTLKEFLSLNCKDLI